MTVPNDIRNPQRVSGYDHVTAAFDPRPGRTNPLPFQARSGHTGAGVKTNAWRGPRRATALEAAQDYCDYINNNPIAPSDPRGRGGVKRAGHSGGRAPDPIPSDIEAAYGMIRDFKAQQAGKPGYVYLIIEDNPGGGLRYGKIGFSTNPLARVRELQTGNPRPLKLHYSKPGTLEDEKAIHERHIRKNVLQEWFTIDKDLLFEWDAEHHVEEAA